MTEFIKIKGKRQTFNILREKICIEKLCKDLPANNEVYKYVSYGDFSSIGFVKFVSEKAKISSLTVATLRVGKKQLHILDMLKKQERLDHVHFIVGSLMKNDSKVGASYGYYDNLEEVCKKNKWKLTVLNNHAKVLLFDTDKGKFVIETSSNLNENPKIEQFSFEKNDKLYEFYLNIFN